MPEPFFSIDTIPFVFEWKLVGSLCITGITGRPRAPFSQPLTNSYQSCVNPPLEILAFFALPGVRIHGSVGSAFLGRVGMLGVPNTSVATRSVELRRVYQLQLF